MKCLCDQLPDSYTKIDFVMRELQIHRITATKYLKELVRIGRLAKHKSSKGSAIDFYKMLISSWMGFLDEILFVFVCSLVLTVQ